MRVAGPTRRYWIATAILTMACTEALRADDARVLPKGRTRVSFSYARTGQIRELYDDSGRRETITGPYQLDLSSEKLKSFDSGFSRLVDWLNSTGLHYDVKERNSSSRGITTDESKPLLGDALSRGHLGVDGDIRREVQALSLMHGLTDRVTVGFAVPVIRTSVNIQQSISGINTAEDIYQGFYSQSSDPGPMSEIAEYLDLLRSADSEMLQTLLAERGYDRFESRSTTGLGDLNFGARILALDRQTRSGHFLGSFQAIATAPTGKLRPTRSLTSADFGQGLWEAAAAFQLNYLPTPALRLETSLAYGHRFAGRRAIRVRRSASDFFPDASSEEQVRYRLGDRETVSAGASYSLSPSVQLFTGYEWYWKQRDSYTRNGDRPQSDYDYLSERTSGYSETLQAGASVSSLPAFLGGGFPVPGELSLKLFVPTRGRNQLVAPYGLAEIAVFF